MLEVSNASGIVVLNGTRGTAWGQLAKGTLVVTDTVPGDGLILVSGAENKTPGTYENQTVYWGRYLHFRVTGGKYKLRFTGSGIDLTAVGVGSVKFVGDAFAADTGDYALDSGKWNSVPVYPVTKSFGVQPTPAPAP